MRQATSYPSNPSSWFNRGGGLRATVTNATIHNTIIANNTASTPVQGYDDVYGTLQSTGSNNLIGINTGLTGMSDGVNGNMIGTSVAPLDPKLGVLRDNGGVTLTHALLPGSPAFDAGNIALSIDAQGSPLTTDQRGYARVYGTNVDIGAFEWERLTVGLYIDSGNTSRFAPPDFSPNETALKNDPEHYGKLIYPNFGDRDHDGILDCWDGFAFTNYYTQMNPNSSESFVPIVVQIDTSGNIDYANTIMTFDYMMAEMLLLPDKTKAPSYCDGEIRIWTRDGGQVRTLWNLKDGGNLVETGVDFTLQELGFMDQYGVLVTDTITLYVEGVSLSSSFDNTITVRGYLEIDIYVKLYFCYTC